MEDQAKSNESEPREQASGYSWWSNRELKERDDAVGRIFKQLYILQENVTAVAEYNKNIANLNEAKNRTAELEAIFQRLSASDVPHISLFSSFRMDALRKIEERFQTNQFDNGFDSVLVVCEDIISLISDQLSEMPDQLRAIYVASSDENRKYLDGLIEAAASYGQQLSLREAIRRTNEAAATAEESAKHVQEVAGETGKQGLSIHFRNYADRQRRSADYLRYGVIVIVIAVAIAIIFLLGTVNENLTWTELVRKLALGLPGTALAAYLARESSRHRSQADWAESIEVQLRTLNAFTDPLDDELKKRIRGDFGKRIFGSSLTHHSDDVEIESDGVQKYLSYDLAEKLFSVIASNGRSDHGQISQK